jgi:hypothetical protein
MAAPAPFTRRVAQVPTNAAIERAAQIEAKAPRLPPVAGAQSLDF